MSSRVLFVSPHPEDAVLLSQMLQSLPLEFDHARDLRQARAMLEQAEYRVILTEADLPDGVWLDVLSLSHQTSNETEVIVTHPFADSRFWAEVLNLGAYDLLAQPFYPSEVRRILLNACSCAMPESRARAAL